ncbi:hypothetical protein ABGB18_29230 [Nonomuraea sp. B12E4]|uniref:hypothetical protein n=1 Tax=Nonomuraea sp. B12E4 TaxID=3153564 RepID=UPI00325CBCE6
MTLAHESVRITRTYSTTPEHVWRLWTTPEGNYLSNAINKVGARNRIDAIRISRDAGWL